MSEVLGKKRFLSFISFCLLLILVVAESEQIKKKAIKATNPGIDDYKIVTATSTIFIAGLGDRSFIITTLMATKYNKFLILLSALSAMGLMSFFSVFLGENLPKYVSYQTINYLAIFIFTFLGLKMLHEGLSLPTGDESEKSKLLANLN